MKTEFERKLKEEGYSYNLNPDGYYKISKINRIDLPIKVQLVESKPINEIIHGSQNGNEIDAIGYFRFNEGSGHNVSEWTGLGGGWKEYVDPNSSNIPPVEFWDTGWTAGAPISTTD